MPGGYGGSAGGGGGGGDGGGDGGGGGDGEGSAHSSEAHTYSESNPQPVPPHLASCSASVHSRIESASHLALAAACDTAASEQSGLLHDAPFSAQHRTAPVAPPGSAHAVSPGMSLYSLAPIEPGGYGGRPVAAAAAATAAATAAAAATVRAASTRPKSTRIRVESAAGPATLGELLGLRASRIESASHLALAAACDTAYDNPSSVLACGRSPRAPRRRSRRRGPHAVSPGMSLYSLAPIELNRSGGVGGSDGGDGGGLGDRGGAGGEHPSKVQSNKLSMPQPVPMANAGELRSGAQPPAVCGTPSRDRFRVAGREPVNALSSGAITPRGNCNLSPLSADRVARASSRSAAPNRSCTRLIGAGGCRVPVVLAVLLPVIGRPCTSAEHHVSTARVARSHDVEDGRPVDARVERRVSTVEIACAIQEGRSAALASGSRRVARAHGGRLSRSATGPSWSRRDPSISHEARSRTRSARRARSTEGVRQRRGAPRLHPAPPRARSIAARATVHAGRFR